ncbi:chemotaxis protein CheW [Flavisphingomonas formosensis]|uniref:chemotaxis protein CheW n=1 Tax=Flavisphingomonas formosensis TaxID=861534 RepID=UPI0012FC9FFF|nr:chemotaxis protein CheW [Sphingomonas formosensis]
MSVSGVSLLAFRSGGKRLGVPASEVREVGRLPQLTRVPLAPPSLLGIGNIRGEAVAVVSLAALLGDEPREMRQIILLNGTRPTALAVDSIEGIVSDGEGRTVPNVADLFDTAFPLRDEHSITRRTVTNHNIARGDARLDLLVFAIGDQLFALPLEDVLGVAPMPHAIARVPGGDAATVGTMSWREAQLPIFSAATLLGMDDATRHTTRIVIVRAANQAIGLSVDRIAAIARPPMSRVAPVPVALLRGQQGEAPIQAIVRPEAAGRLIAVLSAKQLLDPNLVTRPAAESTACETAKAEVAAQVTLLFFSVSGRRYAIPLGAVQEVARCPATITRIHNMPRFLRGIASYRGMALPVVDLAAHHGAPPTALQNGRLLIVTIRGGETALLVGSVESVVRVAPGSMVAAPLGGDRAPPISNLLALDDGSQPTPVLSADQLFDQISADLIAAMASRATLRT